MEDPEDLTLGDIYRMRQEGELFAQLDAELGEERQYVLMLYDLYPNGTTGNEFVQDPEVARAVGEAVSIGPPTDGMGWGIWEVDKIRKDRDQR